MAKILQVIAQQIFSGKKLQTCIEFDQNKWFCNYLSLPYTEGQNPGISFPTNICLTKVSEFPGQEPSSVHKRRRWGAKEYKVSPQGKSCTQRLYCLSLKLWSLVMEAMIVSVREYQPFEMRKWDQELKGLHMFSHW